MTIFKKHLLYNRLHIHYHQFILFQNTKDYPSQQELLSFIQETSFYSASLQFSLVLLKPIMYYFPLESIFTLLIPKNYTYEAFEVSLNFNIYLFILPYFTIHPLLFIVKFLIIEPKQAYNLIFKKIITNISRSTKKSFSTKILNFIRTRVSIWLIFLIIVGNYVIIFIINSNQTTVQRIAWSIDFIQSLLQDLILTPILYIFGQYCLFRIHSSPKFSKKFTKTHQLLRKVLDEFLLEIFVTFSHCWKFS